MAAASVVILSSPPRSPFATRTAYSPHLPPAFELLRDPLAQRPTNRTTPLRRPKAGDAKRSRPSTTSKRRTSFLADSPHGANLSVRRHESCDDLKAAADGIAPEKGRKRRRAAGREGAGAPVKRARSKKREDNQARLLVGKLTKPTKAPEKTKDSKEERLQKEGFHSVDNLFVDSPQRDNIERAVRRRVSWTPPGETVDIPPDSIDGPKSMKDLCGVFGYSGSLGSKMSTDITQSSEGGGAMKKRRIEVINSVIPASETSIPALKKSKAKVPKKKATTITGQATAQYAETGTVNASTSLLDYLQTQPSTLLEPEANVPQKPDSSRRRKSAKPGATGAKKPTKESSAQGSLLAPGKALQKMEDQGFLFGTSSQLAAETSPTMIRQVQEAIRLSEQAADLTRSPAASPSRHVTSPTGFRARRLAASRGRNLWSAASRGLDGSLIEREKRETSSHHADISEPEMQFPTTAHPGEDFNLGNDCEVTIDDTSWHHIDDERVDLRPDAESHAFVRPEAERLVSPLKGPSQTTEAPKLSYNESLQTSRPAKPKTASLDPSSKARKSSQASAASEKPNFEGYPTARLSKELTSFGFKALKNRKQMVALLERCWENKHKGFAAAPQQTSRAASTNSSQQNLDGTSDVAQKGADTAVDAAPAPPKARRGRPRKTPADPTASSPSKSSATKKQTPSRSRKLPTAKVPSTAVEEISDSDSPPTPSPPRRRSPKSPPLPLQLSTPPQTGPSDLKTPQDSEALSEARKAHLFATITRAFRAQPRPAASASSLTWHEKMLLYDPIVLEDLAAWLNTEGLGQVGWDEEVAASEVKAWCEERSVCCLWRENLRGQARARY